MFFHLLYCDETDWAEPGFSHTFFFQLAIFKNCETWAPLLLQLVDLVAPLALQRKVSCSCKNLKVVMCIWGWRNKLVCTCATFLHLLWQVDYRSMWLLASCPLRQQYCKHKFRAVGLTYVSISQSVKALLAWYFSRYEQVLVSLLFTTWEAVCKGWLAEVKKTFRGCVQLNFLKRSLWQWFAVTAYFVKVNILYALKTVFTCKLSLLACFHQMCICSGL